MGGQGSNFEAQHIVQRIASDLVAAVVVAVAQADVRLAARVDDNSCPFGELDLVAIAGRRCVILWLDVDVEGLRRSDLAAVGDVKGKAGGEVLAAVVLELDVTGIDVGLGKRTQQPQRRAVEHDATVGRQGEQAVGDLFWGRAGARRLEIGVVEREVLVFSNLRVSQPQVVVNGWDRRGSGRAAARPGPRGSALVFNLEGMHRQRRSGSLVCIDAAITP